MADYKELLRRAVEALPENNGAARRAVYEKARAALVGQLRAINPPLPARDITAHRLQLEDCIRQVEQEASEAVIAGLSGAADTVPTFAPLPTPSAPVYFDQPPQATAEPRFTPRAIPPRSLPPPAKAEPEEPAPKPTNTIEAIIAAADKDPRPLPERTRPALPKADGKPIAKAIPIRVPPALPKEEEEAEPLTPRAANRPGGAKPLPSIVARAEAARNRGTTAPFSAAGDRAFDTPRRGPTLEPRRDPTPQIAAAASRGQAVARQPVPEPLDFLEEAEDVAPAMSAVREVEVEQPADPQGAIDRAIATLDREARGEVAEPIPEPQNDVVLPKPAVAAPPPPQPGPTALRDIFPELDLPEDDEKPAKVAKKPRRAPPERPVSAERIARAGTRRDRSTDRKARPRSDAEPRGISALTVFLLVFVVLLVGAGGAGIWAWNEGFLNLDSMFGKGQPAVQQAAVATDAGPQLGSASSDVPATGPGNTETAALPTEPAAELKPEARLAPEPEAVAPAAEPEVAAVSPLALQEPPPAAGKIEERLGSADAAAAPDSAAAAVASVDPANMAGSQSLLLEASDNGTTGAVPFSGTVDWSKGTDEAGQATLVGKASIPARNLGVDILIRKNADPSLPASHLMEVNFRVSDSFIGGSVAGLPGVLLKNEELVQGTPLVGASARVVGNSFLFALSSAADDVTANSNLLTSRKWIDLAVIYATGKRAIITLEKDSNAEKLFTDVFTSWGQTASN